MTFLHILPCFKRSNDSNFHIPASKLPRFVQNSPVAMHYYHFLRPIAWNRFPERNLQETRGTPAVPYRPFAVAMLVKLDQNLRYMTDLHQYLCDHPALAWLLGFQSPHFRHFGWRAQFQAPLPTSRHLTRMLRTIPNLVFQFLIDETVRLIQIQLGPIARDFGQAISLDTKHIVAWVQENNPKAYVKERYNPDKQPKGDPDCRLGVKRRRNISPGSQATSPTPTENPVEGSTVFSKAEYYWGYASGVVATKVPGWVEVVLAEMTKPFNRSDISYFFPLMDEVERRLGFRPLWGAFDRAYDAFYVYEHFYSPQHDGFAAVPLAKKGGYSERFFDPDGLPLCQAGLAMPLKFAYTDRTQAIIEHERGKYVCSLRNPKSNGKTCPVDHERWEKGGCTADMPTSIGSRIRYQLDRDSDHYEEVYNQRTATERINSQATELGIERPKLRNGLAITNQSTLIYVLINLRAFHRIRDRKQSGS